MSLYADYIMEREGYGCLEDKESFITYKKIDNALYLRDMYVSYECRRKGKARELVQSVVEIAERMKCDRVITTIDKETHGWERNKKGILSAEFKQINDDTLMYFVKELSNGN